MQNADREQDEQPPEQQGDTSLRSDPVELHGQPDAEQQREQGKRLHGDGARETIFDGAIEGRVSDDGPQKLDRLR
ncbi:MULTISPECIES: hypothetical protein [unclassified Bradyrhizobium]|uniref:hypothetical protein n=1 Tax=unclassified Bradyrhizobium TaxID=2631580 RepID=UPI0029162643|nr:MULTISPECIES: hypothetical protein [unclassified Bradyrhizobium]